MNIFFSNAMQFLITDTQMGFCGSCATKPSDLQASVAHVLVCQVSAGCASGLADQSGWDQSRLAVICSSLTERNLIVYAGLIHNRKLIQQVQEQLETQDCQYQ